MLISFIALVLTVIAKCANVVAHTGKYVEAITKFGMYVLGMDSSDGIALGFLNTARILRRALGLKLRKLRSMLTADEDLTSELDCVVCRLMKLALRSCNRRQCPPPMKWMLCTLFDLLSLTERAIERRKRHFVSNYIQKDFCYGDNSEDDFRSLMTSFCKIEDDNEVDRIVDNYRYLARSPDNTFQETYEDEKVDLQVKKELCKDHNLNDTSSSSDFNEPDGIFSPSLYKDVELTNDPFNRTKAWVEKEIEIVPYKDNSFPNHFVYNSARTLKSYDQTENEPVKKIKTTVSTKVTESISKISKRKPNCKGVKAKIENENIKKPGTKQVETKNVLSKSSSIRSLNKKRLAKMTPPEYGWLGKSTRIVKLRPTSSKPIPESIIRLCNPKLELKPILNDSHYTLVDKVSMTNKNEKPVCKEKSNNMSIATEEKSLFMTILTQDREDEIIALQRTIGTNAYDDNKDNFEEETEIRNIFNASRENSPVKFERTPENVDSQTIFLHDINQPSTSKGVRHTDMDVQCGTDFPDFSAINGTKSVTRISKIFMGIKIEDSKSDVTDIKKCVGVAVGSSTEKCTDFGTSNYCYDEVPKSMYSDTQSLGIKINEPKSDVSTTVEFCTMTVTDDRNITIPFTGTELFKSESTDIRKHDSISEFQSNLTSIQKSTYTASNLTSTKEKYPFDGSKTTTPSDLSATKRKDKIFPFMQFASPPILSCGGLHVHSYKQRQESEDVLYQGTWQKTQNKSNVIRNPVRPITKKIKSSAKENDKNLANKNNQNKLDSKKATQFKPVRPITKKCKSSEKESDKNLASKNNQNKLDPKKATQFKNTSLQKTILQKTSLQKTSIQKTKQLGTKTNQTKKTFVISDAVKPKRLNKNTTKVASKLALRNVKVSPLVRKTALTLPASQKDENGPRSFIKKDYLPKYLRKMRNSNATNKSILNQSTDKVFEATEKMLSNIMMRSKTEEIRTEFMKLRPAGNVNYVVFRNESNKKNSEVEKKSSISKQRPNSPQSQNSSNSSSTNSVITVKKLALHSKSRSHSVPPTNIMADHGTKSNELLGKLKKITKPSKNNDNPSSLCIKTSVDKEQDDILLKASYTALNNKVTVLQMQAENSRTSLKILPKLHNINELNFKIPTIDKTNEHDEENIQIENITDHGTKSNELLSKLKKITKPSKNNDNPSSVCIKTSVDKEQKDILLKASYTEINNKENILQMQAENSRTSLKILPKLHNINELNFKIPTIDKNNEHDEENIQIENITDHGTKSNELLSKLKKLTKPSKNNDNPSSLCIKTSVDKEQKDILLKASYTEINNKENVLQMRAENSRTSLKILPKLHNINELNFKIPTIDKTNEHDEENIQIENVTDHISEVCPNSLNTQNNDVIVSETNQAHPHSCTTHINLPNKSLTVTVLQHESFTEIHEETKKPSSNVNSKILETMKDIIDEALDFVDDQSVNYLKKDLGEVISSHNNSPRNPIPLSPSPISFKTITPIDEQFLIGLNTDIEEALNMTVDTIDTIDTSFERYSLASLQEFEDTNTENEMDLISFKSFSFVSRYPNTIESELNTALLSTDSSTVSVRQIFERKNQPHNQNPTSLVACQAFSGFSMNAAPVAGDQRDYVNLVDSETGSMAVNINRQAISEEVFLSGRSSSGTYASCTVDSDTVVPDWLFRIISQQQSLDGEVQVAPQESDYVIVPVAFPQERPMFDMNGNALDPLVGVADGAGDGRGIHSNSQDDSSGRGSTISSSLSSSEPQSEAILVDPSVFTMQYELLSRDHAPDTNGSNQTTSVVRVPPREHHNISREIGDVAQVELPNLAESSEFEADISSTSSDVPNYDS